MNEYIDIPFALSLGFALAWTSLFSLANNPGIRGYRNLGILACYILGLVFLFVAGWKAALITWTVFGVAGGAIYVLWELLQRLRTSPGEAKPGVSLSPLLHGLFAWPIMVPEAVEYTLAELRILRTAAGKSAENSARLDGGRVAPAANSEITQPTPEKPEGTS
jgi:hypothetical protein